MGLLREVDLHCAVRKLFDLQGSGTFIDPRYFDSDLDNSDREDHRKFFPFERTMLATRKCQTLSSLVVTRKSNILVADRLNESHLLLVRQSS